ncbi:hypothetical protein JCM19232_3076 [Vibrio ishigakensis]|uniref:Uncharacterized protein n=1 Tax=Vibrio ishigakensis TaxID=1481914 RepID=A0A0B8PMV4_9VIBR|nr:hypothetical protein JCM19232_3076 [Vibrio ishigakensis]
MRTLYIGCYTNGSSQGLQKISFNASTGSLIALKLFKKSQTLLSSSMTSKLSIPPLKSPSQKIPSYSLFPTQKSVRYPSLETTLAIY